MTVSGVPEAAEVDRDLDLSPLFQPFACKSLQLANRIVMAPMTRAMSPGGVPGEDVAAYYRRRAENDVGLIVTEGTPVSELGAPGTRMPLFCGDALNGWKRVVDEVHDAGGRIVPQLWHVGIERVADGDVFRPGEPSEAPSGLDRDGQPVAEPMTVGQIDGVIAAFADAAAHARELGFDGVEIHGAHGYLIDQFFRDVTNRRTDEYGGGLAERTQFGARLVAAVRAAVGEDFAIIFRMSQWRGGDYNAKLVRSPEELATFLRPLADAGVDIFHCSTRRYFLPEFEGADLNLAGWAQKLTGKPAITVGGVGIQGDFNSRDPVSSGSQTLAPLVERFERGEFDLVAVGRALLTDPEWARKLHEGRLDELQGFQREMLATLT
jgi:2,4-dienoyl-CoA reductase-like NADH-dependent reductase (Old Yellow Enzyme family)